MSRKGPYPGVHPGKIRPTPLIQIIDGKCYMILGQPSGTRALPAPAQTPTQNYPTPNYPAQNYLVQNYEHPAYPAPKQDNRTQAEREADYRRIHSPTNPFAAEVPDRSWAYPETATPRPSQTYPETTTPRSSQGHPYVHPSSGSDVDDLSILRRSPSGSQSDISDLSILQRPQNHRSQPRQQQREAQRYPAGSERSGSRPQIYRGQPEWQQQQFQREAAYPHYQGSHQGPAHHGTPDMSHMYAGHTPGPQSTRYLAPSPSSESYEGSRDSYRTPSGGHSTRSNSSRSHSSYERY